LVWGLGFHACKGDPVSAQPVVPAVLPAALVEQLWAAACAAQTRAHAPYSRYPVGAAIVDEHGVVHAGCNVENAAFPQGWCAEASALSAMVLAGARQARGILVVGSAGHWITPCGGCRQKLREFGAADLPIVSAHAQALGPVHSLDQLLPHSFGPGHLPGP
jgi:cytidine deaminase